MTRDEIIAMARGSEWLSKYESATGFSAECAIKFANLVAQYEREACAKVCESRMTPGTGSVAILNGAADAIRARGQA
jgi:hypothetical protein